MINKIIEKIIFYLSIFYPVKILHIAKELNNRIFSASISRRLAKVGDDFKITTNSLIVGPDRISVGERFHAFSGLRMEAISNFNNFRYEPEILIGNNVSINFDCHIGSIQKIQIEDNVLIGSRVTIVDHSHGETSKLMLRISPASRPLHCKGPILIGKNTWIGEGVTVLGGVSIGENVVIGANSVVNKSFPSNVVIAGIPAKIIRIIS